MYMELWKCQHFPLQSQAQVSFSFLMMSFTSNEQLHLLWAPWTHHEYAHELAQLHQENKAFGLSDKNGEDTESFGHQIHVVNQKLDLERLMGMMRW